MSHRSFYIIFVIAALIDTILAPSLVSSAWWPRLTLAVLPFLFLFAPNPGLTVIAVASSLFFWLLGGANLGLIVLAVGLMIFFERWILLKIFHREAWQALAASAVAIVIFGVTLAGLSELLTPGKNLLQVSFVLIIITSGVFAVGVNFLLKKIYARR